jgi:ferredoxin-NADP reductase
MKSFTTKLIDRKELAAGTMSFHFEKPTDFRFEPGQYALFTLIDPPFTDIKGNTRAMSIASAPYENDVAMAVRMSDSAFKRSLMEMPFGTEVEMQGPLGHLHLDKKDPRDVVFLAGGIGIVPFWSILLQLHHEKKFDKHFTLFYSNRHPEDTTYYEELKGLQNEYVDVVFTASSKDSDFSQWPHERGRISQEMLEKNLESPQNKTYYIVGVPQMVKAMQDILIKMNVPTEQVMVELFGGY